MEKSLKRILWAIIAVCLFTGALTAGTIPVVGSIRLPNGSRFNGTVRMTLSYPGRDSCSSLIVVPQTATFRVNNGTMATGAITPNDCIQPANTIYVTEYFTSAGQKVMQNNFYVTTAAQFDLGTATPTTLTSSNISFASFTGLTDVETAVINNTQTCVRSGASAGAKIVAAIAAGPSTGVIVDCSDLQGAQTISQDIFAAAGTKPVHLILGDATFTVSVTQNCPSEPVIIEGTASGSGNAPPRGTVLAGSAGLGATPVIRCADLGSRWSTIKGLNISTAGTTSALIIGNLATNLADVFVASTTAPACEINNSVAATFTNVHCSGLAKGLWLHPQGNATWDIALNTFISSSAGCPTNVASNTGAVIEGFTQTPENYFINFDVENCGTGVSSAGSQSHFVGLHTESNSTVGLVESATAQSTYLSRKNNDGATFTASTCYNDIAPRTSPKINHYCDKFDTIGIGVTPNAIVPLGITAISTGGSSGIVLYPDNSTLAVAALFSATNAGVRFGTLTLGRGNSGATVTTITGDPAGVEIMGAPVSVVSGTASAPAIFAASFTTTGFSFSAGPLLSFDVNGAEKVRIDTTNDAVTSPLLLNFAGTFKSVSLGAADSCTAGFKCLRVVN